MAFKNVVKIQCSNDLFQVQNDLRDWKLDAQLKPVTVVNEKYWNMKGVSIDPKFIPTEKVSLEKITIIKDKDNKDVQVIEVIDTEKAIKEAIDKEIAKVGTVVDVPIDPIKGVKP